MATASKPALYSDEWRQKLWDSHRRLREEYARTHITERNFLGSGWSFIVQDKLAFWLHERTGKVLPSSRNRGKE